MVNLRPGLLGGKTWSTPLQISCGKEAGRSERAMPWVGYVNEIVYHRDQPTYCHPNRTGETEQNIWPDESLDWKVALGNVEAKAEGHHGLVSDHRNEHGHHVTRTFLKSDGKALKYEKNVDSILWIEDLSPQKPSERRELRGASLISYSSGWTQRDCVRGCDHHALGEPHYWRLGPVHLGADGDDGCVPECSSNLMLTQRLVSVSWRAVVPSLHLKPTAPGSGAQSAQSWGWQRSRKRWRTAPRGSQGPPCTDPWSSWELLQNPPPHQA